MRAFAHLGRSIGPRKTKDDERCKSGGRRCEEKDAKPGSARHTRGRNLQPTGRPVVREVECDAFRTRGVASLSMASLMALAALPAAAWADIDAESAKLLATVLQPTLSFGCLLMIIRIPMTWYPNIDGTKWPWNAVFIPTEPILGPTRKIIQPVGGVDISPIVWVAILSFLNEILLGPQGILNLLQMKI